MTISTDAPTGRCRRDARARAPGAVPSRRGARTGSPRWRRPSAARRRPSRRRGRRAQDLDQLDLDRGHVERRRDQVVGEARVEDLPVPGDELLHQREPEPLRDPALDLPLDGQGIDRLADILGRPDPDGARQAELDVDLDDDPHRGNRERDVRALAGDLAGLRVERRRPWMAVDALDVDLAAAQALALPSAARRVPHRAGRHPGHPRGRGRAGGADRRRRVRREAHVVGTELGARHLKHHAHDALADLGRRRVHDGAAVGAQDDAGGAESSKPSE